MLKPLGASPEEWSWFARELGLGEHLLPAVPDAQARIAPGSDLKPGMIGAVPSRYMPNGEVKGIADWPDKPVTPSELRLWSAGRLYNLCVRGAGACAFDIDVDDPLDALDAAALVIRVAGAALPMRGRAGSGRLLLPFRLEPGAVLRKAALPWGAGRIELLGTRQQWVACGTNRKSGARYSWAGGLPARIPELSLEEVQAIWSALGGDALEAPRGVAGGAIGDPGAAILSDPVAQHLINRGLAHETRDGKIAVSCPWKAQHTIDGGLWEAVWHVAGSGGYRDGHYSCLHGHCTHRTDADFLQAIGYVDVLLLDDIPVLPESTKAQAPLATLNGAAGPEHELLSSLLSQTPDAALERQALARSGLARTDLTDVGNATRLALIAAGDLRWSWEMDLWLYWTGARWTRDEASEHARTLGVAVAEYHQAEGLRVTAQAQALPLGDPRRDELETDASVILKWAASCRSHMRLGAMLGEARQDGRFLIAATELDTDPWLLGVPNGVVDLRTGQLQAASRDALVTHCASVPYDPDAQAPRWLSFVTQITGLPGTGPDDYGERPKLAAYLKRMLGLLCTGVVTDQKLFVAHGSGSNGKNMLLETVAKVLGDYAQVIPSKVLMDAEGGFDNPNSATPYVRRLQGIRMALASESREGQKLNTGLVKSLTGDALLTARNLNENPVTFLRTFKPVLLTNNRPGVDQVDPAIQGRLHMIPFSRRWARPAEVQTDSRLPLADETLTDVFHQEAAGILAWLVQGAVTYHREGLGACPEVVSVTTAYFEEQDPIGRFLTLCERCAPADGLTAQEFLNALTPWAEDEGLTVKLTTAQVGTALRQRGIECRRTTLRRSFGVRVPAG
jgi:P4 family phage/plasmid primase-like protien